MSNMDEAVGTVKMVGFPPVEENLEDEEKDATCDVEDGSKKTKPKGKLSEIVEGKREKKVIQRLNMQISAPKEKLKIESTGTGVKLGDIARINHSIGKLKAPQLKPLHKIVYDRPGAASSLRKHLRLFNGFTFEIDSDPYNKKLLKVTRLPKAQLVTICQTLDLERSGKQSLLAERIMTFLMRPTNSGKPVIKKKKKKTTKDVKGDKSSSRSKKPQKKVESGKSRAIVTDSSSDDDDDDEDEEEKKEKNKSAEKSVTVILKRNNSESQSSDKDDDDEDDDDGEEELDVLEEDSEEEEESPRKKKSPAKKATKKSEQKSDALTTDDRDQDSQGDKTVKKTTKNPAAKRKTPVKSVPKTKKADSSSNRGKKTASKSKCVESESSDDDQPLIKMIKKPPTDDQLKATIQDLLKDANLEEVTMKQLCRQVYDKYPDFDLTSRKEFIKETVKSVIS